MSKVMDVLAKWNRVSPAVLLWTNAIIALFVLVAHGGYLLLARAGKVPQSAPDARMTYVTIPVALLMITTAISALLRPSFRWPVLKAQSVTLLIGALAMTYFALLVAVFGIPKGENFVWNPVMFAFAVGYPVYLVQRSFAQTDGRVNSIALQAPLWAVGGSILISAAIMWRVWNVGI